MGEGRRRERGADRGADTSTELTPSELQPVGRIIKFGNFELKTG